MQTPTVRLATVLLRQPLADWVQERRSKGTFWDRIAAELSVVTGGQVDITGEWLRRLYGEQQPAAPSSPDSEVAAS